MDTVTGNLLAKEIDPTRDWTTGLAKGILGEAIGESPILVTGLRQVRPAIEVPQEVLDEWRATEQDIADELVKQRLAELANKYGELNKLDSQQLSTLIEDENIEVGRKIIGEDRKSLLQKIEEGLEDEIVSARIQEYMKDDLMTVLNRDKFAAEFKAQLDQMTPEQLADYIEEEFGNADQYTWWAGRQGDLSFDPAISAARGYESDKVALARVMADLLIKQRTGPAWKTEGGVAEFNEEVAYIKRKYKRPELIRAVIENVPGESETAANKMTTSQLATAIAENTARIKLQREKRAKADQKEWKAITAEDLKNKEKIIAHETGLEGNALKAKVTITNDDDSQTIITFARQGLDEDMSLGEQIALKGNADLSVVGVTNGNIEEFQGQTLNQVLESTNSVISEIEVPIGSAPQLRSGVINKILGLYGTAFRPLTPVGLLVGSRYRQLRGRLRAMDSLAQFMALEMERAVLRAVRKGEVKNEEEANKLVLAFLSKTGAQIEYTPEEKKAAEDLIRDLEDSRYDDENKAPEDQARINAEIERLNTQIEGGYQSTPVARRQLPESLRRAAVEVRKGIDSLSERMLTELPEGALDEMTRESIEANLNRYVTRSFALFEPALGWNPRAILLIDSILNTSKEMRKLYNRAVTSFVHQNKEKLATYEVDAIEDLGLRGVNNLEPHAEQIQELAEKKLREWAERQVKEVLNHQLYQNAYDVTNLPGLVTPAKKRGQQLEGVPKLLSARGEIPYAMRKLMGEISDPKLIAAASFSRIAKMVEMATFYNDLKRINDMPGEMWFSPVKIPGIYDKEIKSADELNPLDGYYTTQNMVDMLEVNSPLSLLGTNRIWSAYQLLFGGAKAGVQYGIIVLSPGTQMRNLYGAGIMFMFNGNLPLEGDWSQTAKVIGNELFGKFKYNYATGDITEGKADIEREWRKLQGLGVVNTEVRSNDIIGTFSRIGDGGFKTVNEVVQALYAIGQTGPGKAFNRWGPLAWNRGAKRSYGAADDFFKALAYGAEKIKFKKALAGMDEQKIRYETEQGFADPQGLTEEAKIKVLREFAKTLTTRLRIPIFDVAREKIWPTSTSAKRYRQDMGIVLRNVTDLEKYIEHLSAYMVRNGMPNYDYIGKFAEYWRLTPRGNFIAFPTEILRTTANSAQLTSRLYRYEVSPELAAEIGLPQESVPVMGQDGNITITKRYSRPFRGMALRRVVGGAVAGYGMVSILTKLGQHLFNIDDDELEAAAVVGPPYGENIRRIPISSMRSEEKKGGFDSINSNYMFPYESLAQFYVTLLRAESAGEYGLEGGIIPGSALDDGLIRFALDYASSYTQEAIAWSTIRQVYNNKDTANPYKPKPIRNLDDDWGEQANDILDFVLRKAGPGVYKQVSDVIFSLQEGDKSVDRYGRSLDFIRAAGKVMGISTDRISPEESLYYLITAVKDEHTLWTKQNMSTEAFYASYLVGETVVKDWQDAQRSWFRIQQELYFALEHYKKLNLSEEAYNKEVLRLTEIAGVDKNILARLRNGQFTPWRIPDSIIRQFYEAKREHDLEREWPLDELETLHNRLVDYPVSLTANRELPRDIYQAQVKED